MASLKLRGNTWHLIWRFRGKQKFRTTEVRHDGRSKNGQPLPPPEAKFQLRQLEASLDRGRSLSSKPMDELFDLVVKDYKVSGYRTLKNLESRLRRLRPWFGPIRADHLVKTDLIDYAEERQRAGIANKTIMHEIATVERALRLGEFQPVPFEGLRPAPPRQGFFDDAEVAAVTAELPEHVRPAVWFGYYTGWRRAEVLGLEWSAIDFAAGEIRLWTSKTELPRCFPMDVAPGLRALLAQQKTQHEAWLAEGILVPWVFARRLKTKRQVVPLVSFRGPWINACTEAGCPGRIFHDLRRSAARNLELAGWPRTLIMRWVGHETEAMFHRYRIVSASDREIASKLIAARQNAACN
jgi:integrase